MLTDNDRFNYERLPNLPQLKRYAEQRIPVGHFLSAIICNDLGEAVARADDGNQWLIPVYHRWLYNEADSRCWGSNEKMQAWLRPTGTKCDYRIRAIDNGIVYIEDLDLGRMTVTNDAEAVCVAIQARYADHRIMYLGTDKIWGELKHKAGKFIDYAPGCPPFATEP